MHGRGVESFSPSVFTFPQKIAGRFMCSYFRPPRGYHDRTLIVSPPGDDRLLYCCKTVIATSNLDPPHYG